MKTRTFYATFLLFLAAIYIGIFALSMSMLYDTTRQVKEQSLNEHYFIAASLLGDMTALDSRGISPSTETQWLMQPYQFLAGGRDTAFAVYEDEKLLYATKKAEAWTEVLTETTGTDRRVSFSKESVRYYCIVQGALPEPFQQYTLLYQTDITRPVQIWQQRNTAMLLSGGLLSLILSVFLLLLLGRLFRPLALIMKGSKEIAGGNYANRLPVKGKDEIAEMARSFNEMAGVIEQKVNQLAEAANNRQLFIDNLAHELRTPLTAIYGYAEYMQKAVLSEEDNQFALNAILSESRRMQTMTNGLMELTNLRNGAIQMKKVKLKVLFDSVRSALLPQLLKKGIQLKSSVQVAFITGDEALLQNLLINLVDNAVKASEAECSVYLNAFCRQGKTVIQIVDEGKGMEAGELAHITEPYYRVDKSRSRKDGGAGLGLAICQLIVQRHGGELFFESVPGEGTTVLIEFTT